MALVGWTGPSRIHAEVGAHLEPLRVHCPGRPLEQGSIVSSANARK